MLQQMNWTAFEELSLKNDIVFFYKIQNKLMNIDFPAEVQMSRGSGRLHHQFNYRQVSARTNTYKNSFFLLEPLHYGINYQSVLLTHQMSLNLKSWLHVYCLYVDYYCLLNSHEYRLCKGSGEKWREFGGRLERGRKGSVCNETPAPFLPLPSLPRNFLHFSPIPLRLLRRSLINYDLVPLVLGLALLYVSTK